MKKRSVVTWVSIDFLFTVLFWAFYFHEEFPPDFVTACSPSSWADSNIIQITSCVDITAWVLAKTSTFHVITGKSRGLCFIRFPFTQAKIIKNASPSEQSLSLTSRWSQWYMYMMVCELGLRSMTWLTYICLIQSVFDVLEKDTFLSKLTSYFHHLIFCSYLINEIINYVVWGNPGFVLTFWSSAPLFI